MESSPSTQPSCGSLAQLNQGRVLEDLNASALGVARQSLSKIVNGHRSVTPEMAVRLSRAFGGTPESWLGHQAAYDLWRIEQSGEIPDIKRLEIA
ncbi:MAG: HigA family addiction module antidote protein [Gammaproteobacteria bacterium]|nr:HigA family addiction module antidote protein [Gammaproteobacteria bacterium]MCP5423660.1 HigA family addiction module antidote protein [Gammaproteobacteria bacterium]